MQDFDTSTEESSSPQPTGGDVRERLTELFMFVFKKFIIFVSFGPGVFGLLWLIGRIFKRR
jgi:hypothetical protein